MREGNFNYNSNSTYKISKLLPVGSSLVCADNSGAKMLQIIGYLGYQGTRKRRLTGGVGSIAIVTVKKGSIGLKKKTHYALIIRQKYSYTRFKGPDAGKVRFEDNAAILLEKDLSLKKTNIKGPVAKEVCRRKIYSELNAIYR